jgi:NAD-dependent dihydropyrimidine dehydrogenase PreA subunit
MSVRNIIEIDEELCDGCGECVPSCAEGALQIIDGKARLVSDVLCDGLGACLGECPTGALTVTQRDAPEFDEIAVEAHLGKPAPARPHAAPMTARPYASPMAAQLAPMAAPISQATAMAAMAHDGGGHHGCPGSAVRVFPLIDKTPVAAPPPFAASASGSKLRQWPVQLHLTPPTAPFFQDRDVLLAADCVPVAVADFHQAFLDGRGLAIACPKLDQHLDVYVAKLAAMIDQANIRSLTVAIMEVPCCGGLLRLAEQAQASATRKIPIRLVKIGIRGDIIADMPV